MKTFISKDYNLDDYHRSNQDTSMLHRPSVREGEWVQSGDLLADCSASSKGDLALGKNILIAYMPWEGYNYEDAILVSERLVYDDLYTSIHIEKYDIQVRETKYGKEEITKEIPNIEHQEVLANLDRQGIVKIGSWVKEGDILVGKITPIPKKLSSPYQKLLYTILEKKVLPFRDTSLRVAKGMQAKVIDVKILRFSSPSKSRVLSSFSTTPMQLHPQRGIKPITGKKVGGGLSFAIKGKLEKESPYPTGKEIQRPKAVEFHSFSSPFELDNQRFLTEKGFWSFTNEKLLTSSQTRLNLSAKMKNSFSAKATVVTNKINKKKIIDKKGSSSLFKKRILNFSKSPFFPRILQTKISRLLTLKEKLQRNVNEKAENSLVKNVFSSKTEKDEKFLKEKRSVAKTQTNHVSVESLLSTYTISPLLSVKDKGIEGKEFKQKQASERIEPVKTESVKEITSLKTIPLFSLPAYFKQNSKRKKKKNQVIDLGYGSLQNSLFLLRKSKVAKAQNMSFSMNHLETPRKKVFRVLSKSRQGNPLNSFLTYPSFFISNVNSAKEPFFVSPRQKMKVTSFLGVNCLQSLSKKQIGRLVLPILDTQNGKKKQISGVVQTLSSLPSNKSKIKQAKKPGFFLSERVPQLVHIYLADKRKVQVGDKMSGRHGNKGIISQILPRQDMPYLPDGTPIDLVLNPLGVPSRMNVGQIYECLLGLAGSYLGEYYRVPPFDEIYGAEASRTLAYSKLFEARQKTGSLWLFNPQHPGKIKIFDGRSGEGFDQAVTVGISYMLKLVHLVDDKIHCLTPGHDVLTEQGWISISKIQTTDKVATLNAENQLVYTTPTKVWHYDNYKGKIYHIENQQINLSVTMNHRMWVSTVHTSKKIWSDYKFIEAEQLVGKHAKYLKSAEWVQPDFQFYLPESDSVFPMDAWLTFFGLWISEGWIQTTKDRTNYGLVLLAQVKPSIRKVIENLLQILGFNYRTSQEKYIITYQPLYQYLKKYTFVSVETVSSKQFEFFDEIGETEIKTLSAVDLSYELNQNEDVTSELTENIDQELFVYRSYNKALPDWVWRCSQQQCRVLLNGLVLGDCSLVFSLHRRCKDLVVFDPLFFERSSLFLSLWAQKQNKGSSFSCYATPGQKRETEQPFLPFASLIPPVLGEGATVLGLAYPTGKQEEAKINPRYYTSSMKLAGDVMRLALHAGWSANIYLNQEVGRKSGIIKRKQIAAVNDIYFVSIDKTKNNPTVNSSYHKKQQIQKEFVYTYQGPVYCLEVPQGVFMVRKKGKAVWTGNSRSTGPYSLVTQQPLRGRSKQGGQRLGEMEVWALEGYGAAFVLLELLTVKSDDISGRMALWSNIISHQEISIGTPESFKVLICELQALCLDVGIFRLDSKGVKRQISHLMKLS